MIIYRADISFLLNNFFVAASKKKRNKTGFILYASDSPPLNSRPKKIKKNLIRYFRFDSVN